MAVFPKPPVTTDFNEQGKPAPTFPWERWFQAITNFLSAPQIKKFTPASSTAAGVVDSITYDSNFLYICVATNQWKRVSLSAF